MFNPLFLDMNPKRFVKLFRRPHRAATILFLLLVRPFVQGIIFLVQSNNGVEALHGRQSSARINSTILPKHGNVISLAGRIFGGVNVIDNSNLRCIEIVSISKGPQSNANLFALKDHGQILIVGNVDDKMTASKTKAGRPKGLQRGLSLNHGHAFRLLSMPQMLVITGAFKIGIAHNGPTGLGALVGDGVNAAIDVRQVRGQNGVFVLGILPVLDQVGIPILGKSHVRIHLHGKVLAAVHAVRQMPRKDGSHRQLGIQMIIINVPSIPAQRGGIGIVVVARPVRQTRCIAGGGLINDGHPNAFRMLGPFVKVRDGGRAFVIAVTGHADVNGFVTLVVEGTDAGRLGRRHEALTVSQDVTNGGWWWIVVPVVILVHQLGIIRRVGIAPKHGHGNVAGNAGRNFVRMRRQLQTRMCHEFGILRRHVQRKGVVLQIIDRAVVVWGLLQQ
mmetsp:Transcript_21250/g.58833  ORF Transcript_21250/g.58833 Transcript_21250/m.58833 type:complete len:446 (-) Transcript_21250:45-1382(-)